MASNLEAAFSETQIYFKLSHQKVKLPTLVMKHEKRNYRMTVTGLEPRTT